MRALVACSLAGFALCASSVRAETLSGVCPDGSFFVVQSRDAVPCAQPHFADPADLPPLRPHLLPRPYTWYVDQEARNPNNPYNLIDAAEKIRAARLGPREGAAGQSAPRATPSMPATPPVPAPLAERSAPASDATPLALADDELRDLVRLVALRQEEAPAELAIQDVRGDAVMRIQLAWSSAFEAFALASLQRDAGASHVIVFAALAERDSDFQPNFFAVQEGRTYRPDPTNPSELGFVLGGPGKLLGGELVLGYFVVPQSFDPQRRMELFWNDHSVDAQLAR